MPLRVSINNPGKRRINRTRIKKAALRVLKPFRKTDALIDITFISDKRIRALNKKYLKKNRPTDVISFFLKRGTGDIYISSDTAYRNAKRFKTSFQKELLLYTIHGILHFLGFGDKTAKEKTKIRKLESKFLKSYETAKYHKKP